MNFLFLHIPRRTLRTMIILFLCLLAVFNPVVLSQAHAATVLRGNVEDASSGGIVLDADLHTKEPYFDRNVTRKDSVELPANDFISTYEYPLSIPNDKGAVLGDTISVRWDNVGFDADDDRIDLVLTWLPDSIWYTNAPRSGIPLLVRYTDNPYHTAGICLGSDSSTAKIKTSCEQHLRVSFYKTGTNTPASGSFLTKISDLDQKGWNGTYNDRWCESIEFITGHSEYLYIPDNNILNIGSNRYGESSTDFRATQNSEGSDLSSGVVVSLAHGAEFWYYSTQGFTDILDQFDVHSLFLSSGTGGTVHCVNKTDIVSVGWRGERTVSIDPAYGYRVSNVIVDGTEVGPVRSYHFSNVTSDRSIRATFSPISYSIAFHANGGNGFMQTQQLVFDTPATLHPSSFSRTGYTFLGWNTQPDGSGAFYPNEASVNNLTASNGAAINLYAQWEPNSYTVSFNPNEGSGTMSDQQFSFEKTSALSVNQFSRTGYLFSCWNTDAEGEGQVFLDQAVVSSLTAEDEGTVALYAQWRPAIYHVSFDAQDGMGIMEEQELIYDKSTPLEPNRFTREGYRWTSWNTEPDGSGESYQNREEVLNLASIPNDIVVLYAQWEETDPSPGDGRDDQGDDLVGPTDQDKEQSGPASETGDGDQEGPSEDPNISTGEDISIDLGGTPRPGDDAEPGNTTESHDPEEPNESSPSSSTQEPSDEPFPDLPSSETESNEHDETEEISIDQPLDEGDAETAELDSDQRERASESSYDKTGSSSGLIALIALILATLGVVCLSFRFFHRRKKITSTNLRFDRSYFER